MHLFAACTCSVNIYGIIHNICRGRKNSRSDWLSAAGAFCCAEIAQAIACSKRTSERFYKYFYFRGGVGLKVLVVGNDAELTALTGKILERSGYDTACSRYGAETAGLIEREDVRLVIADIETDEAERIRFCKAVKDIQKPPKLLFIGRSGEEEIPMLNAGADDWIKKPYKTAVFLARASALLRQAENG